MAIIVPIEEINKLNRTKLQKKQKELAKHVADRLSAVDLKEQRAAQAAIRRNEKSIALLTSKLLCDHSHVTTSQGTRNGAIFLFIRCGVCLTTVMTK